MSKVFPIGLAIIALVPALVQLAIAAIAPADFEFIEPQDYFGFVRSFLALFCAVAAPEIIGRDQRNRTLSLYFSRVAIAAATTSRRSWQRWAAALFIVLVMPQVAAANRQRRCNGPDLLDYLSDNVDLVPPILAQLAADRRRSWRRFRWRSPARRRGGPSRPARCSPTS